MFENFGRVHSLREKDLRMSLQSGSMLETPGPLGADYAGEIPLQPICSSEIFSNRPVHVPLQSPATLEQSIVPLTKAFSPHRDLQPRS